MEAIYLPHGNIRNIVFTESALRRIKVWIYLRTG